MLQSMKEGGWRGWRIIQNTWLRHFIYSKNAQANSNLNFGDIVGRGGGGAERRGICAYLLKTPGYALVRGRILLLK